MSTRRQSGISLVEILIWMTVSILLLTVISTLYVNAKQATRVNDTLARLQENARFALYMLDQDLRTAGFRGCSGAGTAAVNVLNTTSYPYQFDAGIAGFRGTGSGWAPAPDVTVTSLSPTPLPTSDMITVRVVDGPGIPLTARMTSATDTLKVSPGSAVGIGDFLMVADCTGSAIFRATDVSAAGVISHGTSTSSVVGNSTLDLGRAFGPEASVYRLMTRTYFVAPSQTKPGTTSLWVANTPNYAGGPNPAELVQGVERARFTFGEDTDGDRAANRYVNADAVASWPAVVSVKPQVLLASTTDSTAHAPQPYVFDGVQVTPTDSRLRSVLASVVTLRNRVP